MSDKIDFVNLSIEIKQTDDSVTYAFRGDVDENFRQQDLPRISKSKIIFELKDIDNFNSCGIREWIYLIKDISGLGSLQFRNCSVTMIDQINMVPDSLGTGEIESFFAPYFCPNHGEKTKLIEVRKYRQNLIDKTAPEFTCDECDSELEFDALEESYFLFAENGVDQAS